MVTNINNYNIHQFGAPKSNNAGELEPDHVVTRTLMRNPSASVRQSLELLHSRVQQHFGNMTDESLAWLLGGSRLNSRGGFQTVADFKNFLAQPPTSSSRLITGLESIMTAVGYRHIRADWTEAPHQPVTPHEHAMAQVVDQIMQDEKVSAVATTYKQRYGDDIASDKANKWVTQETLHAYTQDVSDASDVDDVDTKQPKQSLPTRNFKTISDDGQPSWIAQAEKDGVYARAHTSGTAPLACAAIEGLLRNADGSHELGAQGSKELYTTLLIPQFHRSDYHSIAETEAGIEHFIGERDHKRLGTPMPSALTPKAALINGINAITQSTRDTVNPGETVSPKKAIEEFKTELFKNHGYRLGHRKAGSNG